MALHPVGPLPASTYWRRRGVLLLVVVVLLLLARACTSGGGHPHAAKPKTKPTPTHQATTPPATGGACPDTALTLATTTDARTYALGAAPKLTLLVTNTGQASCSRDLGSAAVELLVYSANDRIWSSDDCGPRGTAAVTTLAPGGKRTTTITWSGKRSAPGCTGSRSAASAGTYYVVARVGSLRAKGAVFSLHG